MFFFFCHCCCCLSFCIDCTCVARYHGLMFGKNMLCVLLKTVCAFFSCFLAFCFCFCFHFFFFLCSSIRATQHLQIANLHAHEFPLLMLRNKPQLVQELNATIDVVQVRTCFVALFLLCFLFSINRVVTLVFFFFLRACCTFKFILSFSLFLCLSLSLTLSLSVCLSPLYISFSSLLLLFPYSFSLSASPLKLADDPDCWTLHVVTDDPCNPKVLSQLLFCVLCRTLGLLDTLAVFLILFHCLLLFILWIGSKLISLCFVVFFQGSCSAVDGFSWCRVVHQSSYT